MAREPQTVQTTGTDATATKAKRRKIDPNTLSPEEREKYERARAPRTAYLVLRGVKVNPDQVIAVTRDAEQALEQVTQDPENLSFVRIKVK